MNSILKEMLMQFAYRFAKANNISNINYTFDDRRVLISEIKNIDNKFGRVIEDFYYSFESVFEIKNKKLDNDSLQTLFEWFKDLTIAESKLRADFEKLKDISKNNHLEIEDLIV